MTEPLKSGSLNSAFLNPPSVRGTDPDSFFEIFIPGEPVPKGSWTAFIHPGSKSKLIGYLSAGGGGIKAAQMVKQLNCILIPSNKNLESHKLNVILKIQAMKRKTLYDCPVIVFLKFFLSRTADKSRQFAHAKPDIDKLQRQILDCLEGVVYTNDSRVVMIAASKGYYGTPGVNVKVIPIDEKMVNKKRQGDLFNDKIIDQFISEQTRTFKGMCEVLLS